MEIKIDYEKALENFYATKKEKSYYSSTEIMKITGICERTLRYRLKKLSTKYKNIPSLLNKKNQRWRIHYTIVDEFLPHYKPRTLTISNFEWKTFTTWNMANQYDSLYHFQLINEVKENHPESNFIYTIEKTKKGVNHVHLISDMDVDGITTTVNNVLGQYLSEREYDLDIKEIINKANAVRYIKK